MVKANQRVRPLATLQEASGTAEGTKTAYGPEFSGSAAVQAQSSRLITRRRSYEQTGAAMESPLRGVGDLAAHYEAQGWTDIEAQHAKHAPSMYEFHQLAEGGYNPFPLPTRWEDLSGDEQARAHAGLAAHGTSMGRMTADLGRGLDRAYVRSSQYGQTPYAANFYEPEGFPREQLSRAMPGAPEEHAAAAIALTSPKNKFAHITQAGQMTTPNVNAAAAAAEVAASGRYTTGEQFKGIPGDVLNAAGKRYGQGGVGLHGNVRKAAYGIHQGLGGADITEWTGLPTKAAPESTPLFGSAPKTSPFAGSFIDRAAPFTVGDIHMASIAFPHLSGLQGSGVNVNPSGADTGNKSEREMAMDRIPHAHAALDYAMRQVMGERGLHKTRYQQGAAWGEQQIARTINPEPGQRRLSYHPETVYGWQGSAMPSTFTKRTKRGAGSLYLPD